MIMTTLKSPRILLVMDTILHWAISYWSRNRIRENMLDGKRTRDQECDNLKTCSHALYNVPKNMPYRNTSTFDSLPPVVLLNNHVINSISSLCDHNVCTTTCVQHADMHIFTSFTCNAV
jgi:hypothetical protein